jgi:hypothetical protein
LSEITWAALKAFLYRQQQKLSGVTVRKQLAYLSKIISHAVDDEIISFNPCSKLSKIVPMKDKKADNNPLNLRSPVFACGLFNLLSLSMSSTRKSFACCSLNPGHCPFS